MGSKARIYLLTLGILLVGTPLLLRAEDPWVKKARVESGKRMAILAQTPNTVANWPPRIGELFPEISLVDHEGRSVDVESWRGKPTLIEVIAMTCAGCQAFAGGNKYGGFDGFPAQQGLDSIEQYYREYTSGHELFSDEINFVQLIIYNQRLDAARPIDLAPWRKHFKLDQAKNTQVLTGGEVLANKASFGMIPGFILLDNNLRVRFDATGHTPKHSLFTDLLPALNNILITR